MLLTREFDYAMCIMRALKEGQKRSVKEICAEESIPEPFTYKILKKLEKKGIVKSIRGAKGGYVIAKEMSELSLMDIMLAIEPIFGITESTKVESVKQSRIDTCQILQEYERIQARLVEEMSMNSLAQIMCEQ